MRRRFTQQSPVKQLEALAKPYRFRVQADAEGFPIIPGRYGRIEWHCDGVNCHSCALPDQVALAVYTERPRLFSSLGRRVHPVTFAGLLQAVFQETLGIQAPLAASSPGPAPPLRPDHRSHLLERLDREHGSYLRVARLVPADARNRPDLREEAGALRLDRKRNLVR